MRITHQSVTLNKETNTRLAHLKQQWFQKWNRILASVVCILGFILLFSFVMTSTMTMDDEDDKSSLLSRNLITQSINQFTKIQSSRASPCSVSGCSFTCKDFKTDITQELRPFIEASSCQKITQLTISKYTFPGKTMRPGWLDINLDVQYLEIQSCDLDHIEPSSFDTSIFRGLKQLLLRDLMLSHLKDKVFDNLITLEKLTIREVHLTAVDYTVMEPVKNTLRGLYIIDCPQPLSLQNVTGNYVMNNLEIAELTGNNFGIITATTFAGLTKTQSLYLLNSGITKIEGEAFKAMTTTPIVQVHLEGNELTTLSEITLKELVLKPGVTAIHLHLNKWVCSCELEWLQQYKREYPEKILGDLFCGTVNVIDYDFSICKGSSSTKESTISTGTISDGTTKPEKPDTEPPLTDPPTTESSPASSTETDNNNKNYLTISCKNYASSTLTFSGASKIEYGSSNPTKDTNFDYEKDMYIKISQINEAVTINVSPKKSGTILYFKSDYDVSNNDLRQESIGCYVNVNSGVEVRNLTADHSYTVCALNKDNSTVSPFSCRGFHTLESWENRTWISNSNMMYVIGGVTSAILLALLIGALLVYCCFRRRLLNKHRSTEAIIIPPYGKPDYLIPMSKSRPPYFRSSSDGSMVSARSYVSAVEPTPMQLMSWRLNRMREIWDEMEKTKAVPDMPPPLPPRNSVEIDIHSQLPHAFK